MSVFVAESHPSVPGAHIREALLERGAELERERIVSLLKKHSHWLVFGDDKTLLNNVITLILDER